MQTRTPNALFELATVSLACRQRDIFLKTFSARTGAELGARAVLVWITNPDSQDSELVCRMCWSSPGERLGPIGGASENGLLSEIWGSGEARRLTAIEAAAANLGHLDEASRRRVRSAVYAPIPGPKGTAGVIEVLNKLAGEFTLDDSHFVEEAARLAGQALTNLEATEGERQAQLATVERLTALYDLGLAFTSTLDLQVLLPIVAGKIRDILGAGACNLWLLDPGAEQLRCAQQAGEDPTVEEGSRGSLNDGLFAEVTQRGIPKLVETPSEEPAFEERRVTGGDFKIVSWMAAPLRKEGEVLGVVEVVNKADGAPFNEEDLFFLSTISEQAAAALQNANLLEAERKAHVLDALLKISKEITATLDLDHVLTTVVHQASVVVPFDRCVIGFFDRGKFVLGGISGEVEVPKSREMNDLRLRLEWVASQEQQVWADLYVDGWHLEPESTRAQFTSFLEAHSYNGLYALPLRDDQGTLGVMALLSSDADFLTPANKETVAILANHTTVAIRNAQLYQQLPLASFLQPLAKRKEKLLSAVPPGRGRQYAERIALIMASLLVIPWPLRVGTDATIVPAERRLLSSTPGGVVERVFIHEGDMVQPGQLLAQLDPAEHRVKHAQAQAALAQARRELAEAEFRNDPSAAGLAQIRADLHSSEVVLEQQRLDESELRAPIAGVIVTPKVEEREGTMIHPGDAFCEIVAQDRMAAEMSVPEEDFPFLRSGNGVAIKLNALPSTTFRGAIDRMGAQTKSEGGDQYFLVRAVFDNTGGRARDGMVGRARVRTGGGWFQSGWYPVGYIILRAPVSWVWEKVWSWLP